MARKVRLGYPGVISNVMNRGDRRGAIFPDDPDRECLCASESRAGTFAGGGAAVEGVSGLSAQVRCHIDEF
jgi:hypothetical protein